MKSQGEPDLLYYIKLVTSLFFEILLLINIHCSSIMCFCKSTDFKKGQIMKSHFLAHLGIKQELLILVLCGSGWPSLICAAFSLLFLHLLWHCCPSAFWRTHRSFDCSPPPCFPAQSGEPWKDPGPSLPPLLETTAGVTGRGAWSPDAPHCRLFLKHFSTRYLLSSVTSSSSCWSTIFYMKPTLGTLGWVCWLLSQG